MSSRSVKSIEACAAALMLATGLLSAQGSPKLPAKTVSKVPRTPWGDPDLQGIWPGTAMMGVPMERPRQFGDRHGLRNILSAARAAEPRQ
jgi:hypothetical protein